MVRDAWRTTGLGDSARVCRIGFDMHSRVVDDVPTFGRAKPVVRAIVACGLCSKRRGRRQRGGHDAIVLGRTSPCAGGVCLLVGRTAPVTAAIQQQRRRGGGGQL